MADRISLSRTSRKFRALFARELQAVVTRTLRKFQMVYYEIRFMQTATMTVLSGPLVSHLLEYRSPVTHHEFYTPASAYPSVLRFFELATVFVGTAGRCNRGMDGTSAATTFFHPLMAQYFRVSQSRTDSALSCVLYAPLSHLFGAVTHYGLWLGYPDTGASGLTFPNRECSDLSTSHTRQFFTGCVHDCIDSYRVRFSLNRSHVCGVFFECPMTPRTTVDAGCANLFFPATPLGSRSERTHTYPTGTAISWSLDGRQCSPAAVALLVGWTIWLGRLKFKSRLSHLMVSFPLPRFSFMAIYLEGNIAASIGFSLEARTLVSLSFARNLRLPPTNRLLLTTSLPVYGTFSTLLQVEFSADLTNDVCLGLDWSSFLRESLILSGYRPGNAFDAATFLLSGGASFSGLPPLSHGRSLNVHPDDTPGGSGTRSVPVYNDVEPHNDITRATYSSRSFTAVATPSSRSATSDCDKRRPDLSSLLLSSHSDLNVFMLPSAALKAELEKHHISGANDLSDDQARYAILSHLLCGACIGTCDNANASLHACSSHIGLISSSMGLPSASSESRDLFLTYISTRRRAVVDQHSAANPALAVLDNVDKLPKGSLISLAQSHGLSVHKKDSFVLLNLAQLRRVVWEHLGAGECTRKESYASYLGCSSVASQLCDPSESLEGQDDPSVRMQVAILKNLVPILKIGPLRRLLDLHDVAYGETDKIKRLRRRLKKFLYQLVTGKPSAEHPEGTRRGDRSRVEARLSMQWPQLVPDHLKKRLLANLI
ncbi:hypothetical protein B0H13DRAFT_1868242 [Mycena leptocephala]|nr:hypothetical protein B0H13DRAFT_1868242 [Mycena leptocephala]